jgi:hypothetical protein
MLTSSRIRATAASLGFDLCGIAPAESFPELSYLQEWLAKGYAGHMTWMTRTAARRAHVRHVVPAARSVIVTGTLYKTDRPYADALPADIARISRYPWSDDYHDVLKERLDALLAWMRLTSDVPFDARGTSTLGLCRNASTRSMPALLPAVPPRAVGQPGAALRQQAVREGLDNQPLPCAAEYGVRVHAHVGGDQEDSRGQWQLLGAQP